MLIIVKPVGNFCNLRCDYCFYNELEQWCKKVMSFSLLEKLICSIARLGVKKAVIIWHGGEPLLAGINFYKKAVEMQKKYEVVEFENRLQTNATLINEEWIKFFKENNFGIGISLDGISVAHDSQRFDSSRQPTFSTIIANIELMQSNGLRFGLIQTVTKQSLPFVLDSQNFFYKKLGLRSWNVNLVDEDSCPKGKQLGLSEEDAFFVYKQLIEFWSSTAEEVIIDEIDHYVAASLGRRPCSCHYNGRCGNFCCIDYDGAVYPCDRICSSPQDIWGNLESSELSEIIISSNAVAFRQKARQLHEDCEMCEWKNYCNNGCTAMRTNEGKYRHCGTRKKVFNKVNLIVEQVK